MKIGVVSNGCWEGACDAPGLSTVSLPGPSAGQPYAADVAARLAAGEQVLPIVQQDAVNLILDGGAAGLTLVKGPGGMTDLKLTHEVAGVPLVSHLIDPIYVVFQGLPWEIAWQVLASKTWVQAVWDANHADELSRFGAHGCIHVPPAAPVCEYDPGPLPEEPPAVDVLFVGDAGPRHEARVTVPPHGGDWISPVAAAVHADCSLPFFEIYHSLYQAAEPPDPSEPVASRAQKAAKYFLAKRAYLAALSLQRRDRFVVFLKRRLGNRMRVVGRGWEAAYGIQSEPPPETTEQYLRQFREAAINVNLIDAQTESALNPRHFEITAAGGFLLCYDHDDVAQCFKIGDECDTFTDEQSLLEKISYYLGDPARRLEIALSGQRRTLGEHLYGHRLKAILHHLERIDSADPSAGHKRKESAPVACAPGSDATDKLLILLNPGSFTRHYLKDMDAAASTLGIPTLTLELGDIWAHRQSGGRVDPREFAALLRRERVRAVLSSSHNGLFEWPAEAGQDGCPRPFFECMAIPHLMWWTDHPQWANERFALRPDLQPMFRSPNNHYFVKSEVAAREIGEMLCWPNCRGMPVAEDPERLKPVSDVAPDLDIVAIVGSPPSLDPALRRFVDQDDPDVEDVTRQVSRGVTDRLSSLWERLAPTHMRPQLQALGQAWVSARSGEPDTGSFWLFQRLEAEYPQAAGWLRANPSAYFDALYVLWEFSRWQRTFVLAYLGRYFRVGVFGSDWSSLGLGGSKRVDHDNQPAVYARGRIAVNISQAGDEEGVSHKPFQIAASGVPMLHIYSKGLGDCFTPGSEVATFRTPREARDAASELLDDSDRRAAMAAAARERLCREHTWQHRLPQMLAAAGVCSWNITLPADGLHPVRRECDAAASDSETPLVAHV